MFIEQTIKPVSQVILRNDSSQLNQNKETFHDIFQRTLNYKSGSRPPKIELTGILIPLEMKVLNPKINLQCKFKLETDQNEYLLRMSDAITMLAKKLEWEEVKVNGYFDPEEGIFEVEKISLCNWTEPYRLPLGPSESYFELDEYKKVIARKGKLDIIPEYLAS